MILGDEIAAALPELRAQAESMMVDSCRVRRLDPDNPSAPDPDTLALVPNYLPDDIYTGPCRIAPAGALSPREVVAGGLELGVNPFIARLPLSLSLGIKRGDVLEVTAVDPRSDPDQLGKAATVMGNLGGSQSKQRTLVCQEVS